MVNRVAVDEVLLSLGVLKVSQSEWNVLMKFGSNQLNELDICKAILKHRSVSMDVSKAVSRLRTFPDS
tara:strand:- start:681 stop:884 length:204 start_codon:yes stop_codon:yes gene_type:complete